jgi:hypothetical protein
VSKPEYCASVISCSLTPIVLLVYISHCDRYIRPSSVPDWTLDPLSSLLRWRGMQDWYVMWVERLECGSVNHCERDSPRKVHAHRVRLAEMCLLGCRRLQDRDVAVQLKQRHSRFHMMVYAAHDDTQASNSASYPPYHHQQQT